MSKKLLIGIALLGASSVAWSTCSTVQLMSPKAIQERLTPPGSAVVAVAAQSASKAAAVVIGGPKQVYTTYCHVCHEAGVAGAPKFGDAAEWAPRIEKGMDVLLDHVLNGFGAMPAKGTCAGCTSDDLKSAIEYMIEASS